MDYQLNIKGYVLNEKERKKMTERINETFKD